MTIEIAIAIVSLLRIVPETPRWLLARGRRRECKELLDKILEDSAILKDIGEDYMSQLKVGAACTRFTGGAWRTLAPNFLLISHCG